MWFQNLPIIPCGTNKKNNQQLSIFLQLVPKTKKTFHVKSKTTERFIVFHFWHCLGTKDMKHNHFKLCLPYDIE